MLIKANAAKLCDGEESWLELVLKNFGDTAIYYKIEFILEIDGKIKVGSIVNIWIIE
jgi:hypothetical protein